MYMVLGVIAIIFSVIYWRGVCLHLFVVRKVGCISRIEEEKCY